MNHTQTKRVLAVDLGASSGRVIAVTLVDGNLALEECHRFETKPSQNSSGSFVWNFEFIVQEILTGIRIAAEAGPVDSIGIDTWGVDFGLLDEQDQLIGPVVAYRDSRTNGVMEDLLKSISREDIFRQTGLQFLPFNTIYQFIALRDSTPELLEQTNHFLMIPDLIANRLTGSRSQEFTNATTTQLYNPQTRDWAWELIDELKLPRKMFPTVIDPGQLNGTLTASVAEQCKLSEETKVISVASHDTGSAVVGVPASSENFAYLSSGTWSLIGTEVQDPQLSDEALQYNFTNEGGVEGTYRLLKNMMGLWIFEQIRDAWIEQGEEFSYQELVAIAASEKPSLSFIDPDDARFLHPGDMVERIKSFCSETGQVVPSSRPEVLRCIFESLALKTAVVMEQLEAITNEKIDTLHIVGGGAQNELLCQLTANAINRSIVTGPLEATALGNAGVQFIASGAVENLSALRSIIAQSFSLKTYQPEELNDSQDALSQFKKLLS